MAISFPTSLDNFTNPSSGNTLDSPSHSLQHSDVNDAVEAIEAKLGVGASPAGSATAGQVLTISAAGTSTWSTPNADGLTLIKTTTIGTTVSSVNVDDVFSDSYLTYLVSITINGASTVSALRCRMRVSGSDNTSSNYRYTGEERYSGVDTEAVQRENPGTSWRVGTYGQEGTFCEIRIDRPFATTYTRYRAFSTIADETNSRTISTYHGGSLTVTTSYTGLTIFPDVGSINGGSITVYGIRR